MRQDVEAAIHNEYDMTIRQHKLEGVASKSLNALNTVFFALLIFVILIELETVRLISALILLTVCYFVLRTWFVD